jgi:hypothetical protein
VSRSTAPVSIPVEGPVDELDIAWDLGRATGTEDFGDARVTFLCFVGSLAPAAGKVRPAALAAVDKRMRALGAPS